MAFITVIFDVTDAAIPLLVERLDYAKKFTGLPDGSYTRSSRSRGSAIVSTYFTDAMWGMIDVTSFMDHYLTC